MRIAKNILGTDNVRGQISELYFGAILAIVYIFPSLKLGDFGHVICPDKSRASEIFDGF